MRSGLRGSVSFSGKFEGGVTSKELLVKSGLFFCLNFSRIFNMKKVKESRLCMVLWGSF